jgi:hypothetical protein
MFELVVFAQKRIAEATLENPAAMVPNATLAFDAGGVLQRTGAGVRLQAFSAVTHPGLAKVTNGTDHLHANSEYTDVFDHTIASFQHALDLGAVGAHWKALNGLAEVAKCSILLLFLTFVAFHNCIAGKLY